MTGLPEWQKEMARVVGDDLVREIVRDHRRGRPEPSSLAGSAKPAHEPVYKGGPVERPLGPPPGVALCDALMDVQDKLDRAARAEQFAKAGVADGEKKASGD